MTFAKQMQQAIEQTVLKQIRDGKGVSIPYNAAEVPASFIRECWGLVDQENLKKEIAQRIVNKFETEVANDIKQVLSDKEQRENVRAYIRKNISTLIGE